MSVCSMNTEAEGWLDSRTSGKSSHNCVPQECTVGWQAGTTCLHVCSAVFEAGGRLDGKASEKGLLQLLFDVRLLWDALLGGRALGDPQPDPGPSQTSAR